MQSYHRIAVVKQEAAAYSLVEAFEVVDDAGTGEEAAAAKLEVELVVELGVEDEEASNPEVEDESLVTFRRLCWG